VTRQPADGRADSERRALSAHRGFYLLLLERALALLLADEFLDCGVGCLGGEAAICNERGKRRANDAGDYVDARMLSIAFD
jgi:hypothetical protein